MPYIGVIFGNDHAHSPRVVCLRKQKDQRAALAALLSAIGAGMWAPKATPKEVMAKLNAAATMLAARPVYPR
jgi:hypothetical protein